MTVGGAVMQVVGGARSGGIVVRLGKDRTSREEDERLSAGALVRSTELDAEAGRMHYELLSGSGPRTGWVTIKHQGRELLRPWRGPLVDMDDLGAKTRGAQEKEEPPRRAQTATMGNARRQQDRARTGKVGGLGVVSYDRFAVGGLNCKAPRREEQQEDRGGCIMCSECGLPIGNIGYGDEGSAVLHGECQAQLLLRDARREEKARQRQDAELKKARRVEHEIGWRVDRIPRNAALAGKLGVDRTPQGMYCLFLDEESNTVHVRPTADPAASVNLAYLSTALQVRVREGREPLFSLDPKGARNDRASALWQVKRFEPAWLAGTSVGEVMFQADVHLKELSMGEYVQPVAGMKSCFDLSMESGEEHEWNAREWFVVRKAEMRLAHDGALVPHIKMGVEAREQLAGPEGLEDALLTGADHPLVKYAEEFEHYFDVIAERKSVILHLRELAKASALAKYIMDSDTRLDASLLDLAEEPGEGCRLEIPQLWNERLHSQIQVQDGKIVGAEEGIGTKKHGLYGGVQFGLEAVQAPGIAVRARAPPLTMAKGTLTRAPVTSGLLATGQEGFSYAALPGVAAPRGVDLNLGTFDLSSAARMEQEGTPAYPAGSGFFRALDASGKAAAVFGDKQAGLFRDLYNPILSDRRDEADLFVPPSASPEYIQALSGLVEEERARCQRRQEHFLSAEFDAEDAGPLFPSSWTPSHDIARAPRAPRELHPRADYLSRKERLVKNATPTFNKATEDGTKFRVYQLGSLEVRTIQGHDAKEEVRAVFSTRVQTSEAREAGEQGAVVRATEYVEGCHEGLPLAGGAGPTHCRFYVIFETEAGDAVVTERFARTATWAVNPEDLEARGVLARIMRSVDCRGAGLTLEALKAFREEELQRSYASDEECARYAEDVFGLALPALQRP